MDKASKSSLNTVIDLDSDETPLIKGVRSVRKPPPHKIGRAPKQIAYEFDPELKERVRCSFILQTESLQCGANLVGRLLAQNLIPSEGVVRELLDILKDFHYTNPQRTRYAFEYASALINKSARFERHNGRAIIGPSSWEEDVEVLLSLSTDQALATSGIRLTHELQAAACGAKLLALMLKTELLGYDLSSTNFDFNSESLQSKPTVAVLKKTGFRYVLQTVTKHTAKSLFRHSKYLLDSDSPPSSHPNHVPCCASYAQTCLNNLGSVLCYTAFLLCAKEHFPIKHHTFAYDVRDAFLTELERFISTLPKMNSKKKKTFITNLKLRFLLSLHEEFAYPLQDMVGSLIGLDDELVNCFQEEAAKQESDDVPKVAHVGGSSLKQLARKGNVPIQVRRQNELLEAYELDNKNSSVVWVEFACDGKREAVSRDRIFRGPRAREEARAYRISQSKKRPRLNSAGSATHDDFVAKKKQSPSLSEEKIKNTVASVSTPSYLTSSQSSNGCICGEEKMALDKVIPTTTCPEAPPTDMLKGPTLTTPSQDAPEEQLVPQQNPKQQYHQQLAKHSKTVASFVDNNFIGEESWQTCRYCAQKFPPSADGLSRHELSCPVNIQLQQILQQKQQQQQCNYLQLQHDQLQQQFQQQHLRFDSSLQALFAPSQDAMPSIQMQMTRTAHGLNMHPSPVDFETAVANLPTTPIVLPTDKRYTTSFTFHVMSQLQSCTFTEADRLGRRRDLEVGYAGLACRHCAGSCSSGRFFPSSIKTMSSANTLNAFFEHICKCEKCPVKVKKTLHDLRLLHHSELLKMPGNQNQLVFFTKIWSRLHEKDSVSELPSLKPPYQEQPFDTPPFPPMYIDGSPHQPWTRTPNHSWAVAPQETLPLIPRQFRTSQHSSYLQPLPTFPPQETPQWQQQSYQTQPFGTFSFNPMYNNGSPYQPSTTPNNSRAVAPQEALQWQQEQLLVALMYRDWETHHP